MDESLTCNPRGDLSLHDARFALLMLFIGLLCNGFASAAESPLLYRIGIACNPIALVLLWAAYWRASLRPNGADATPTDATRRPLPLLFKLAVVVYLLGWIAFDWVPEEFEFGRNLSIVGLCFAAFLMMVWLNRLIDRTLRTENGA
jgi:hypothetical protein